MDSTHLEEWLGHEHTQALRDTAKRGEEAVLQRLITACRQSIDPNVRGAVAQYEAHQHRLTLLSKGT